MRARAVVGLALVLASPAVLAAAPAGMARVGPGVLRPVYVADSSTTTVTVTPFWLDRLPVTNADFLAFARAQPRWQRGQVPRVFADDGYLAHWAGPTELGPHAAADQPVTRVSWFAARAYCRAQGKRLPTEDEWELAAAAGDRGPDGAAEPGFRERILAWYSRPAPARLPAVGGRPANHWGIRDLHGLVWEWVLDFNSTLVSSDSRGGRSGDRIPFCGAGALAASDKQDYAGFMRTAFRASLEARYTTRSLGFRCARDLEPRP
jgi:formylglycine-generating enzyme required for sulfatase activity